MPGSEHHYGVIEGAVIRDWYCDNCGNMAHERLTCLQIPTYPRSYCKPCSEAIRIANELMDTVGMQYPYGIYNFRDHLIDYLIGRDTTGKGRKYYHWHLAKTLAKAGMELQLIEQQYQHSIHPH